MIIAFKNRSASPGSRLNQLISFWTRSEWTHCEIVLESFGFEMISARVEDRGVAPGRLDQIIVKAGQWEFYQVPQADETAAYDFLKLQMKARYNYWGIATDLVLGANGQQAGQWFCSELTFYVLQRFSSLDLPNIDPARVTPGQLRALLRAMNCLQLGYIQA